MRLDKHRVALVTNVLAHYRVRCFEALAARLPGRIDFFLLADTMAHRKYVLADARNGLPLHVLAGRAFQRPPFDDLHLNDPRPALQGYDLVILSGWAEPSFILLWSLAKLMRKRVGFWIESTASDLTRTAWKEVLKRRMLAGAAGVVVPGTRAREYCERLDTPPGKIFTAPNAVNVSFFQIQAWRLMSRRHELRAELNLTDVVILFVGRMVDAFKNVSTLLAAQRVLEEKNSDADLILVGEGPDRAKFETMAREWNLRRVRFINFLEQDVLCRYYAAADIFVLPSRSEPWGFVLNEAMEFGLPLVVSNIVGAAPDLVFENENGFIVAPDDAEALASSLERLVRDESLRAAMGARSREIIAAFTPEAWADGFARAIRMMLQ